MAVRMIEKLGVKYETANDWFKDVKRLKRINVRCKGFRTNKDDGEKYPVFAISLSGFPILEKQEQQTTVQPKQATDSKFDPKALLLPFVEALKMGLPLSDKDLTSIPFEYRATLFKEGYLHRVDANQNVPTEKIKDLFQ